MNIPPNAIIEDVHISTIRNGDAVIHNDKIMTVCDSDIKRSDFMGISIFGDTYVSGRKPIKKVTFKTAVAI